MASLSLTYRLSLLRRRLVRTSSLSEYVSRGSSNVLSGSDIEGFQDLLRRVTSEDHVHVEHVPVVVHRVLEGLLHCSDGVHDQTLSSERWSSTAFTCIVSSAKNSTPVIRPRLYSVTRVSIRSKRISESMTYLSCNGD